MSKEPKKTYPPTESYLKRTEPNEHGWVTETHPSYGVIGLSRVSGHTHLFESGVSHMHFISLTISEAHKVIDGVRNHVHSEKRVAEVWMTESQFAQMITQPNQGDGVPCTIHRMVGDDYDQPFAGARPEPPVPAPVLEKYEIALKERAATMQADMAEALKLMDKILTGEWSPSKTNLRDVREKLYSATRSVEGGLPYVIQEAQEGLEKMGATAKLEFETYLLNSLASRGLSGLANEAPRLPEITQAKLTDGNKE